MGFAAHGVVYLLIGWFAVQAALYSGSPTDAKGALARILGEPLGQFMLAGMAVGLLAYALHRLVGAVLDLGGHGSDAKGLAVRGGHVISGFLHVGLAFYCLSIALGMGIAGSGSDAQGWSAWLMAQPFGDWILAAIGVGVMAAGVMQLRQAVFATFMDGLSLHGTRASWVKPVGRAGYAARSAVFALVGLFLLSAAWFTDPDEAGGLAAALRTVQEQPQGPWLLGFVAVGLVMFGLFCFIEAAYRRIADAGVLARLERLAE